MFENWQKEVTKSLAIYQQISGTPTKSALRLIDGRAHNLPDITLDLVNNTSILRTYSALADTLISPLTDLVLTLTTPQSILLENSFPLRIKRGLPLQSACLYGADLRDELLFWENNHSYFFSHWKNEPHFLDDWVARDFLTHIQHNQIAIFSNHAGWLSREAQSSVSELWIPCEKYRDLIGICQNLRESKETPATILADLTTMGINQTTLYHLFDLALAHHNSQAHLLLKVPTQDKLAIIFKKWAKNNRNRTATLNWLKAVRRDLPHLRWKGAPHWVAVSALPS